MNETPVDTISLSVITAREPVSGNRWIDERWNVLGVVPGAVTSRIERRVLRAGPEGEHVLWGGLSLKLRKGEVDSYYHNLIGQSPGVYVYCDQDEGGEPRPRALTVDYIDAMSHGEFGNATHKVPMPPDVYRVVEAFVLAYYKPDEPKMKRKHESKVSGIWGDD